VVTVALVRPLTLAVLAEGAARALAYPLGYATVGLVLGLRRPVNPIGWLFAAAGLAWSLSIPVEPWLDQLLSERRPLPLAAQAAAVYGEFNWAPATVLGVTLPALLVPDGRLRSRRWRAVAAAALVAAVLVLVGFWLAPARLEDTPIANPFGLTGPAGAVAAALAAAGTLLWAATMVASLACVVLRFRSATGVERQQLRWVATGAAAAVAGLLAGAATPQDTLLSSGLYWMVQCIPLGVAVAVLRYRLWDLDRLISRTVTYGLVTGLWWRRPCSSSRSSPARPATPAAWPWPPRPSWQRPCSRRCAAACRIWSTSGSTAAATTPPARWRASRSACVSRSTWMRSAPSC
jgi:hypothetical protein